MRRLVSFRLKMRRFYRRWRTAIIVLLACSSILFLSFVFLFSPSHIANDAKEVVEKKKEVTIRHVPPPPPPLLKTQKSAGEKEKKKKQVLEKKKEKIEVLQKKKEKKEVFEKKKEKEIEEKMKAVVKKEKKIEEEIIVEEKIDAKKKERRTEVKRPNFNPNAPGEFGRAVIISEKNLPPKEKKIFKQGMDLHKFNLYVSDMISVRRSLPDVREAVCKSADHRIKELPDTSVIIVFHNEAWSVLLRTVHSVLDRSPPSLVKEILLVDDKSDLEHLQKPLEDYMQQLEKVRVIRNPKREGLIAARLLGYQAATGTVLTFLDSHCECNHGWLEPLLARIHQSERCVVSPVIDTISERNFHYSYAAANNVQLGGFSWSLTFNWHTVPQRLRQKQSRSQPLPTPAMAGGLFSISKKFFAEIGTYDAGMKIWGGENVEMSVRIWTCGGTLEIIPCSHVGHVFRAHSPHVGVNIGEASMRNTMRFAAVWLDEFSDFYFSRFKRVPKYGDVADRVKLRKQLQCKPFRWFLKNVYPELYVPSKIVRKGEVRAKGLSQTMCLDAAAKNFNSVILYPCHGQGGNQFWSMSANGELLRDGICFNFDNNGARMEDCHNRPSERWIYDEKKGHIQHRVSGLCLEASQQTRNLLVGPCRPSENQSWSWKRFGRPV